MAAVAATVIATQQLPVYGRPAAVAPTRPVTVTLVTGDHVTLASASATTATVQPGPGRDRVGFTTTVAHGHLLVVPADAARLIQDGRVDRRLFDLTGLVKLGYDDAHRATVPLIMQSATLPALKTRVRAQGATTGRDLPSIRGMAVTARKDRAAGLWTTITTGSATPQRIWLDGKRQPALDQSVPQIGAPAAWSAGLTGQGMQVALLDTGVDATHPDLAGRIAAVQDVTGEGDQDDVGHGTHVASTIAGNGAASGGKYKGVAPEASILAGKVCGPDGCPESAILAGMQWAAQDEHARVINMSLGGPDLPGDDPLEDAVNTLTAQTGALFVIAAGNSGPGAETTESPGTADAALTVAAVDKSDRMADFSSRGPRTGDAALKPDIAAPGVDIVAARAKGTELGEPAPDFPDSYVSASGTSMATPHVAGAAILLAEQHPDWKADRLKATLMASAKPLDGATVLDEGAGRVDVAHAIQETVFADPPSLSFGRLAYPHTDDQPVTKTLTYHNTGTAAVTLTLAGTGPFTPAPDHVTIAAGGTADVTVTADPRSLPEATYGGELTATAGTTSLVTPMAIDKESEHHTLTLRHIGLDGQPTNAYLTQVIALADDDFWLPYDDSGTVTLRLPKGRYSTATYLGASDIGSPDSSMTTIYQPVVDLSADTTITFDARDTTPVTQAVPSAKAVPAMAWVGVTMTLDGLPMSYATRQPDFADNRIGRVGDDGTEVEGFVSSSWSEPGHAWYAVDQVPDSVLLAGYRRRFADADFATDVQQARGARPDQQLFQYLGEDRGSPLPGLEVVSPASRPVVNHVALPAGTALSMASVIGARSDYVEGLYLYGTPRTYRPGEHTVTRWGSAAYGPAFDGSQAWSQRQDGDMVITVEPTGDADGHVGWDTAQSTTTRLYRDGVPLDVEDGVSVFASGLPDAAAAYRLEQHTEGSTTGLATTVDSVFTFASSRPATDGEPVTVPLVTVRAAPALDAGNAARAGSAVRIPLSLRGVSGARVPARSLTAQVSFDDGKTWAPVRGTSRYPAGSGFVSLRVHGEDDGGRTVTQTVLRAYRFH